MRSSSNLLSLPLLVTLCFWVAAAGAPGAARCDTAARASLIGELWGEPRDVEPSIELRAVAGSLHAVPRPQPAPRPSPRRHRRYLLPLPRAPGV